MAEKLEVVQSDESILTNPLTTCAAERQCVLEYCDSYSQIALCCQALTFQENCYEGRPWLKYSVHADAACRHCCRIFKSKVNGWRRKPLLQSAIVQAWTQNRPTNNMRFIRFVNLLHFVSEMSHLLREESGLRNCRF